ncbi:hypothetical protein C8C84_2609 [Flavobacterium sp. 102]|nr:hypothetical protein C8C84_2609 [Flavobacterium sp. 102]
MIPLVIYIFLPGIVQQIFMEYDDYYFYIIVAFLLLVNVLLAFNILKSSNRLPNHIIAASIVTGIGILSGVVVANLNLGWDGIRIAIWSNAISSILTWEIIFQFNRKKTAANSGLQ